jgi:hypothetical protein
MAISKIGSNGDTLWHRVSEPPAGFIEVDTASVIPGLGGEFLYLCAIAADSIHPYPFTNVLCYVMKIDTNGDEQWGNSYSVDGQIYGEYGGHVLPDGGFVLSSTGFDIAYEHRFSHYVRITSVGDTVWTSTLDSSWAFSVEPTWDGGLVLEQPISSLVTPSNRLTKVSAGLQVLWTGVYGSNIPHGVDPGFTSESMVVSTDSSYIGMVWYETGVTAGRDNRIVIMKTERDVPSAATSRSTALPASVHLFANYPNPFNPTTEIAFDLPRSERVQLRVFDVTGRCVSTLADGEFAAGHHNVTFDGRGVSSGVYFYQLVAGDYRNCRKMVLLK